MPSAGSVPCRCRPTHRGQPVDADALNAAAFARPVDRAAPYPFLIVPGFTPRFGWRGGLHPKNAARLERARCDLEVGLAPQVIVTGGAVHSRDNEAVLMRQWLLARGVPAWAVVVEPCARHTTTNLRNAGRIVLARGADRALVVTSDAAWRPSRRGWRFAEQAYYLGFPWLSTYHLRCAVELGHTVGQLDWVGPMHVRYRPSEAVFRASWKETRAGDP